MLGSIPRLDETAVAPKIKNYLFVKRRKNTHAANILGRTFEVLTYMMPLVQ
jgi:hypothetical protein